MISWRVPALLRKSENRFGVAVDDPKIVHCAAVGGLLPGSVVSVRTVPTESQQSETECLMIDDRRCLLQ